MAEFEVGDVLGIDMSDPLRQELRTVIVVHDGPNKHQVEVWTKCHGSTSGGLRATWAEMIAAVMGEAYRLGKESK